MSFKIGQLRRNQLNISDYQINKKSSVVVTGTIDTNPSTEKGIILDTFKEGAFKYNFKEGCTYYINFSSVPTKWKNATVYIKLVDSEKTKEMIIKKQTQLNFTDMICFTPNRDYNYFVVQINRNTSDLQIQDLYCELSLSDFYELENILNKTSFTQKFSNLQKITSLGIQGPEGLAFAINGEDFKIGKSGVYVVNDVEIEKLSFYLKKTTANENFYPYSTEPYQFFIMDFEY